MGLGWDFRLPIPKYKNPIGQLAPHHTGSRVKIAQTAHLSAKIQLVTSLTN